MSIDWRAQRAAIENEVENVLPYRKKKHTFLKITNRLNPSNFYYLILQISQKCFRVLRINHKQEAVHSFLGIIENST